VLGVLKDMDEDDDDEDGEDDESDESEEEELKIEAPKVKLTLVIYVSPLRDFGEILLDSFRACLHLCYSAF